MDLESTKQLAEVAAPFTTAIVETWVKPKLDEIARRLRVKGDLDQHAFANRFQEYLNRSYDKHSYLNVLVLQNQRKRLEDLYIPLTVTSVAGHRIYLVDDYKEELIGPHKRVLLRDTAGMGKSTIMKFLFLRATECNQGIPIFIELRKLGANKSVVDTIHADLNPVDDEFSRDLVLRLIRRGDFVFFLDGYDEIPFSSKEEVTRELQDFISKARENTFIITSRPETSLAALGDFQGFNIQPLSPEEAFSLLRRYDSDGPLSSELIAKLSEPSLEDMHEFLSNPLLVSLLYRAYDYRRTIPLKKHLFYRQVYDALFQDHDLSKPGPFVRDKWSRLGSDEFDRILRVLGFVTMKQGVVEYTKDELLTLIRTGKEHNPGITFAETDFLRDLLTTVPLFVQEGDYYRWSHKSLQEYFAAQFIYQDTKGQQDAILLGMYRSTDMLRYLNVLDLLYDLDYKSFRRTIIYSVASEFLTFLNENVPRWTQLTSADIESVEARVALTFHRVAFIIPASWAADSDTVDGFRLVSERLLERDLISEEAARWNFWPICNENRHYADFMKPVFFLMRLLLAKQDPTVIEPSSFFGVEMEDFVTEDGGPPQRIQRLTEPLEDVVSRVFDDEEEIIVLDGSPGSAQWDASTIRSVNAALELLTERDLHG